MIILPPYLKEHFGNLIFVVAEIPEELFEKNAGEQKRLVVYPESMRYAFIDARMENKPDAKQEIGFVYPTIESGKILTKSALLLRLIAKGSRGNP